jgi:hypothetical protein
VAYEVTRRVAERKCAPLPIALFPAAVSAPHLYAIAVMKLYVQHSVGASQLILATSFACCHMQCLSCTGACGLLQGAGDISACGILLCHSFNLSFTFAAVHIKEMSCLILYLQLPNTETRLMSRWMPMVFLLPAGYDEPPPLEEVMALLATWDQVPKAQLLEVCKVDDALQVAYMLC